MKKIVCLIILILNFSCKKQEVITQTSNRGAPSLTNGCTVGKWEGSTLPINLKVSSDFSSEFTQSLIVSGLNPFEQMMKVWNDSITNNTFFITPNSPTSNTGYSSLNAFRDNEMGIYKSYNWFSEVSSGALAITQFFGTIKSSPTLGNYISLKEADIIVNYRDFNGDLTYNITDPTLDGYFSWDIQTVLLHEMGHFLGMCHDSSYYSSIMKPYYLKTQRSLFSFDKTKITDLYVNNLNTLGSSVNRNALSLPPGSEVSGRVELMSNGKCVHYLNGKKVFEHTLK